MAMLEAMRAATPCRPLETPGEKAKSADDASCGGGVLPEPEKVVRPPPLWGMVGWADDGGCVWATKRGASDRVTPGPPIPFRGIAASLRIASAIPDARSKPSAFTMPLASTIPSRIIMDTTATSVAPPGKDVLLAPDELDGATDTIEAEAGAASFEPRRAVEGSSGNELESVTSSFNLAMLGLVVEEEEAATGTEAGLSLF